VSILQTIAGGLGGTPPATQEGALATNASLPGGGTLPSRDRISLRFWQGKGRNATIAALADRWFDRLTEYVSRLTQKIDFDADPLELIDLLAWQRDIDRLPDEPEMLYRKRVKFALLNAGDAGSRAGFARIWERLGLGEISQRERADATDWDVIRLRIDEYVFGKYNGLFDDLIARYGRTCRRYVFESQATPVLELRGAGFSCEVINCTARQQ